MATICLNMIVKNETRTLRRCFDSLKSVIDYWVIVDTGSTDGTQDLIRSFAAEVPGELHVRPWVNFGHNRTEGVQLAQGKADYILLMDADNTLRVNDPSFRERLTGGGYYLRIATGLNYWITRIIKSGLDWRYHGVTHEYIDCEPSCQIAHLSDLEIIDYHDGGAKHDKYERDIRLLTQGLRDEPDNVRYMFYLAQSYRDIGDVGQALTWYARRAQAGGWFEEVWMSLYEIACLRIRQDSPEGVILQSCLDAYQYDPGRCEPLYELCRYYRKKGDYHKGVLFGRQAIEIPFPAQALGFVLRPVYDWMRYDELAVCQYYTGDYAASSRNTQHCLGQHGLAETDRARLLDNLGHARRGMGRLAA
ncbi:MAG: glycosyltransferase [Blastocatellia bacterium]